MLFEYLGEEYPDVLGSILSALKAIVNVVGMSKMQPPIRDLLPRLTPVLKNRHERVQEECIDLVGRIAGELSIGVISIINSINRSRRRVCVASRVDAHLL